MKKYLITPLLVLCMQSAFASANDLSPPVIVAPQPTTCIASQFSASGSEFWKNVSLVITNKCNAAVDFQNAAVNFTSTQPLNTNFWGSFNPLSYPDNNLQLTSQKQSDGNYLVSFNLHFPTYQGSNSVLGVNQSITVNYGAASENHVGNASVFVGGTPVETGSIVLTNATAKPNDISQAYALVHLKFNGQEISAVQLPWTGSQTINNLSPGTYNITADGVGNYQGNAVPASLSLTANQIAKSTITYSAVAQAGKVSITLPALPSALSGYTGKPSVLLTLNGQGSSVTQALNWNATTTASLLVSGGTYNLSTPSISYNGYVCAPSFNPTSLVANPVSIPVSTLSYSCAQTALNNVTLNVNGAPTTLAAYKVTLTPNNSTSAVVQSVALSSGKGSSVVKLPNSVAYTVSGDAVAGYTASFAPQPLVSTANAVENITLAAVAGGTPVAVNGQLKVCGTKLCNKDGQAIQLRGMSSHGLQWYGLNKCLTQASLDTLANTFKASIVRLSLYVQEGGYETNPTGFTTQMNQLITEATKRGMYAIVDWHMLTPGDPNYNLARAKTFFTNVATANKGKVNLIYEIANEPSGVSWSTIKSYAEQIIPVIRAIDPNAVILVGTPGWSSLGISEGNGSQEIINSPVNATNVMYTFHFYAASHGNEYYNELDKASNSLPIFVSEWGSQEYTGGGNNNFTMSDRYLSLMSQKKIGWTNWNYSDDFLSGAIWKEGTCSSNVWTDTNLKPSGVYVKAKIISG